MKAYRRFREWDDRNGGQITGFVVLAVFIALCIGIDLLIRS
jgi:hypothetical protein